MTGRGRVAESEGDTNRTDRRAAWQAGALGERTHALLARDSDAFLHQSVSTPCLNAIVRAEGIWIEDADGRRFMDFHGNNVHHVGYGHLITHQFSKRSRVGAAGGAVAGRTGCVAGRA